MYLSRQVTVADIETDALWEFRREAAQHAGLRAAWSAPIVASDGQVVGTFAVYQCQPGVPSPRDQELMLRMAQIAGIAIERRSAEDALRESEAKFRGLFESMMEGVYRTTRDGKILVVNPAFVQMLGYSTAEELYRVSAGSLYWYPSDRETYVRRMESEGEVRNDEYVLRRKDGSMLVVVDNGRVVRDKQERVIGFEGTIADITERKKAETAVFQAKERAQVTLQSIGDAVITTDSEGRIDYMNPVAESLTGWENREAQSQLIGQVLIVVDEVTREAAESPVMRCLREGQMLGLAEHTVLVNRRGQEIAIQDSAAPIRDRAGNLIGAVMVFHDVSKERRLHRALHYQASHDALTGLINRREFENRLTGAVRERASRCGFPARVAVPRLGPVQAGQRYVRSSGGRSVAQANHRRAAVSRTQRRHAGPLGRRRVRHPPAGLSARPGNARGRHVAPGDSRLSIHLAGWRAGGRSEHRHRRNHQRHADRRERHERRRAANSSCAATP